MAETYSVPGTPRVYIDNFLFARAINMKIKVGGVTVVGESTDDNYAYFDNSADNKLLWDLDPVRYITLNNLAQSEIKRISVEFFTEPEDGVLIKPFLNLMHTTNYAGVFNHNLSSGSNSKVKVDLVYNGGTQPENAEEGRLLGYGGQPAYINSIVGEFGQEINEDGFILSGISLDKAGDEDQLHQFDFVIRPSSGDYLPEEFSYNIGSFSVGTYLDFPVSPDLSVKMGYSHEGVQSKRTIAGKDLTHVSYHGSPNWATLPPFTTSNEYNEGLNFSQTGLTGRKTWDMKFSYIDKTDMFNAIQSGSSAGIYTSGGFEETSSIIGTYLSRSLGGKLKHILQPDNTKNEFYMVKLDQKSTSITQVAHGVFEVAFKFVQVW